MSSQLDYAPTTASSLVWGKVMRNMVRFAPSGRSRDPVSTLKDVGAMITDFAPELGGKGCEAGRLRFNGDCIIEVDTMPLFDVCPKHCSHVPGSKDCQCVEKRKSKWMCPEGVDDTPADYVVSLVGNRFAVRPVLPSENVKKLPKTIKVVKMCLDFNVGLVQPICPATHRHVDGSTCYREAASKPVIPFYDHLKSKYDSHTISGLDCKCDEATDFDLWEPGMDLTCKCKWSQSYHASYRCPPSMYRTFGSGDYFTHDELIEMKKIHPQDYPNRMCYAKEFFNYNCYWAERKSKMKSLPLAEFGEWTSDQGTCWRDIWHPPSAAYCTQMDYKLVNFDTHRPLANLGEERCVLEMEEKVNAYCDDKHAYFEHHYCVTRSYTSPTATTCDKVFSEVFGVQSINPIVRKEQNGDTCKVTRFIPAYDDCVRNDCSEVIVINATPRCPNGRLDMRSDDFNGSTYPICVIRKIKEDDDLINNNYTP